MDPRVPVVSTLLEVAGVACAVVCAALAGGAVWAFGVACPCLLLLGLAAEGGLRDRGRGRAQGRRSLRRRG